MISLKEYSYVILLEKWFFGKEKDLRKLAYLIDYTIPMDIENYQLAVALNTCGWIYDYGSISEENKSIVEMKKTILELLNLEIKEVA